MQAYPDADAAEPSGGHGDPINFGRWLRAAREEGQITQQTLANRAGLSRSYLSDLERGRGVRPALPTLERLAAALGMSSLEALWAAGVLGRQSRGPQRQEEDRLLARWRGLSEPGRAAVERFIRFVYQEEQRWEQPSFVDDMFDRDDLAHGARPGQNQPIALFEVPVADDQQS
jgi:transcriptional regulator with XRE-family HTH domain